MKRRYLVTGVVQGVGFRYFTRRAAHRLGLGGWVRNLPDGRVEAEAVGPPAVLGQFEAELRRGPTGGRVTNLQIEEIPDDGLEPTSFEIR